jgi:hypothetical protein
MKKGNRKLENYIPALFPLNGSILPKVSLNIYIGGIWYEAQTYIQRKFSTVFMEVVPGLIKMCID